MIITVKNSLMPRKAFARFTQTAKSNIDTVTIKSVLGTIVVWKCEFEDYVKQGKWVVSN
jgi:hypothetical protein